MPRSFLSVLSVGPIFRRDIPLVGAGDVIRWWEARRFFFNCVVGCTGIITCALLIVCAVWAESAVGEPIGLPDGPLLGVFLAFFYGILANIVYTGGWLCELLMRTTMTAERAAEFGVKGFRIGVQFSVFVTLCPAALSWLLFAIAFFKGQKQGPPGE
jgi:hypothetical protein